MNLLFVVVGEVLIVVLKVANSPNPLPLLHAMARPHRMHHVAHLLDLADGQYSTATFVLAERFILEYLQWEVNEGQASIISESPQ